MSIVLRGVIEVFHKNELMFLIPPLLYRATLLCLSKIVYEYNSYLDADILDQVVEIVAAMMSSKHKEILKGVLSFIKAS